MKIVEVVIYLEIFDFFQKKVRFFKKSEKSMIYSFSPFQMVQTFKQLNKLRWKLCFSHIFIAFQGSQALIFTKLSIFKALATMAYPTIEC